MGLSRVPWLLIGFSFLSVSASVIRFPAASGFSGDIIDPSNPRMKITYDVDVGRVTFRDAFLTILDGFATAAEFAESTRCDSFHALDPEAHAVFHIGQGFSTRFDQLIVL